MKIIKLLRIKIIISIVLVQLLILTMIFTGLNLGLAIRENSRARDFLQKMSYNNGHGPEKAPRNNSFSIDVDGSTKPNINPITSITHEEPAKPLAPIFGVKEPPKDFNNLRNYFAVNVSYEGAINEIISDFPLNYSSEEVSELILKILSTKKRAGLITGMQFLITPAKYGTFLVCILNRSSELYSIKQFRIYSAVVVFSGLFIALLIAIFISKLALNQTAAAFEKQKQFIADAGHELKTPIAVINANIDVLSSNPELSSNKFFQYIKSENTRMGELVRDLLYLARDDADRLELITSDFDFSNAVENAILPFEVMAFESGMELTMEIEKGIILTGEEKSLKQLFVILVDNAIKNSDKGAKITVKAYSDNQKIYYKVRNTGAGISKEELQKIFLRFYRSDASRARKTGGYGLGLAIAQTIAVKHGGSLTAASEEGSWAEFTLTLPKKVKRL